MSMDTTTVLPKMKSLEEYDISAKTGFLPSSPPLRRLKNDYFAPWEDMMDDFNGLLLAGKLRAKVHKVNLKLGCIRHVLIHSEPDAFT